MPPPEDTPMNPDELDLSVERDFAPATGRFGRGGTVVPALKQWRMACPKGEADLVFPDGEGGPVHHEILLRSLGAVMSAAGVVDKAGEPKYGPHAFRHFFASWCINPRPHGRELPPKAAQALLGHSSITMTLDTYGHLFPRRDDPAELAKSVSALLA